MRSPVGCRGSGASAEPDTEVFGGTGEGVWGVTDVKTERAVKDRKCNMPRCPIKNDGRRRTVQVKCRPGNLQGCQHMMADDNDIDRLILELHSTSSPLPAAGDVTR